MPLKDLLVHLDGSKQSTHRRDYAIGLARRHDAHLTGLYTLDLVPDLSDFTLAYPEPVEHYETYAAARKTELGRIRQVEEQFHAALRREGIEGEWRFVESLPAETAVLHARYADLAIVGQIDPNHHTSANAARLPEKVLMASGRPVLIYPYAGAIETFAENVLVGWQPTREAARALADAMPFLERARKVTVLTVNPERGLDSEAGIPVADIAHHLARHGVCVEAGTTIAEDIASGDALLNYAADIGADLLVMGGYGHSRAREALLGGVTRQILEQLTVPVLMSH